MGKLAQRIGDKRLLKIIRRYLEAGVMVHGVVIERHEGTPQGGPLSPWLSNVLLDELDKELESRGHKFVRYADDCNIYVRSKRAAERVMASLKNFLQKRLRLKVNEAKSAVAHPWERKFLGFSFWADRASNKIRIAPQARKKAEEQIRKITGRTRGVSLETMIAQLNRFLTGWLAYFRLCETPSVLEALDPWIRRRLRCFKIKQWKNRPRTRFRELRALGLDRSNAAIFAASRKGWWPLSECPPISMALPASYFAQKGLINLRQEYAKFQSA
jgi:group II intron reverse transcriptase/maturase